MNIFVSKLSSSIFHPTTPHSFLLYVNVASVFFNLFSVFPNVLKKTGKFDF